jgi:peptidyl-prolyl cis-trans isomerase C
MRLTVLLPLLALPLVSQDVPAPRPAGAKPAPKPAPVVLARIGGQVLLDTDVDALLESMPQQQRMQFQLSPEGRPRLVQQLTEIMLLAAKARKDGLDKSPIFQASLRRTADSLLAQELMKGQEAGLREKMTLSEADVKAYFEGHKDQFKKGETFDARHILVGKRAEGSEKERTEEEVAARVKEIQAELAAGKPFEELVDKYTDDPGSKPTKGLYEGIGRGRFVPEFEKAAFAQEIGKVGEPVKTQFGVHIIRVEKRAPAAEATFEEVKAQVQQAAQADRQKQIWDEFLAGLKREIPVEVPGEASAPAKKTLVRGKATAKKTGAAQ